MSPIVIMIMFVSLGNLCESLRSLICSKLRSPGHFPSAPAPRTYAVYEPVEATNEHGGIDVVLDPIGSLPPGMVHVPSGSVDLPGNPTVQLDDFLIGKYEATNRDFKKFVDAGGYRNTNLWKFPFVKDGRTLSFEQAMNLFRDKTDRAGPSTGELGGYPSGQDDYPVSGVSWYEAAAYAEFAGMSLPTVYHCYGATPVGIFSDILQSSNFSAKGPASVGSYPGLGPFGTYDMAGNVKEWCFNAVGGRRSALHPRWRINRPRLYVPAS